MRRSPDAQEQRLAELGAWQLIDWRFLLPRPLPATVAASVPPAVARALSSCGFRTIGAESAEGADAFILCDPGREDLTQVRTCLPEEGLLQVHVGASRRAVAPLAVYRRWLLAAGFTQIETYWAIPHLDAPRMLVPLDERAAVRAALTRQGDARWTVRALLVEFLLRSRLIHVVARHGILVAEAHR